MTLTATRSEVRFLLNDGEERLTAVRSSDTLLDHLRLTRRLRGTKEGCAEGDCGACTVLVGRRTRDGLVYEPVNACIRLLASVDLCHVVTVEHVARGETLHPVQAAMADLHGSQCGFCTPGFVMSLYALWMRNPQASGAEIEEALQGNLCRCTGYAPIVAAAKAAGATSPADDPLVTERAAVLARLSALDDGARVDIRIGEDRVVLPASVDDLAEVFAEIPKATIVAGSTDVGLWITKFMRSISPAIFIAHLEGLQGIEVTSEGVTVGAGVSYDGLQAVLDAEFPHLSAYWRRIGGWQVRAMGTVGGNIANGSPIGDTPPVLIAMGATVRLRSGTERRTLRLEDFFLAYKKQDRRPGEYVRRVCIPRLARGEHFRAFKLSKRIDEDISAVLAAFKLGVEGRRVTEARVACGGMAGIPARARNCEAALIGASLDDRSSWIRALDALATDFAPIGDHRASAAYRTAALRNLLLKALMEVAGTPEQATRLRASRGQAHAG
jgi:xanthine dehydrogenase small subunit